MGTKCGLPSELPSTNFPQMSGLSYGHRWNWRSESASARNTYERSAQHDESQHAAPDRARKAPYGPVPRDRLHAHLAEVRQEGPGSVPSHCDVWQALRSLVHNPTIELVSPRCPG